jgi:hypothetical protein
MLSAADYEVAALKVRVCSLVSIGKLSRREEIKAQFKTMSWEEQNNLFIWPASSAVSLLFFILSRRAEFIFPLRRPLQRASFLATPPGESHFIKLRESESGRAYSTKRPHAHFNIQN